MTFIMESNLKLEVLYLPQNFPQITCSEYLLHNASSQLEIMISSDSSTNERDRSQRPKRKGLLGLLLWDDKIDHILLLSICDNFLSKMSCTQILIFFYSVQRHNIILGQLGDNYLPKYHYIFRTFSG